MATTDVYEYFSFPYGLINGPATFQKLMHSVLRGLTPTQCMFYFDDVIIFSKDMKQHVECLRSVFNRLEKANLCLSLDKCHFSVSECYYLGHPSPRNVKELQCFIDSCTYYCRFIKLCYHCSTTDQFTLKRHQICEDR
ncbi:hypothetical protein PR048_008930 [Dryococelus australis]|uniref:Reverse transcriptase domain-containing protein n=1 Tax=Dryococelus australis TaxID=614101 RepID=A0ABQ9HZB2_9NEOP|nr:hypothetical protein PR048_008930 [Dryococelus australis]